MTSLPRLPRTGKRRGEYLLQGFSESESLGAVVSNLELESELGLPDVVARTQKSESESAQHYHDSETLIRVLF